MQSYCIERCIVSFSYGLTENVIDVTLSCLAGEICYTLPMSADLIKRIKEQAEPGVVSVIEWALAVQADTMEVLEKSKTDHLFVGRFSLDEREEARQILLDYGAGKPARIIEHIGNKRKPICFETEIVRTNPKQLTEPDNSVTIDAEILNETPHP
jgi:hypothetical protein